MHKNWRLEYKHVTAIEAHSPVKIIEQYYKKNTWALALMAYVYAQPRITCYNF